MKKYEHLGKSLSREEQKSIGGGLTQYANMMCDCFPGGDPFPVCGSSCYDVETRCTEYCLGNVSSYGACVFYVGCI
ncbi:MAG: hypothetical protein Q8L07_10110 [Sediminibacterium sp.]|nr:hypothetical protein [Sediminibacterium sp.]MDP1810802.1 hypothetical protein [Sediminibacterium sp.]MDP3129020.1 hypothetical protein [Sediminibacterium sp.]